MEIRRRFDTRKVVTIIYLLAFFVYILVGLTPAEATNYAVDGEVEIPAIGLVSDVTELTLKDHQLETPSKIAGSFSWEENKTLLVGHSSTVFQNLHNLMISDVIKYNGTEYIVTEMVTLEKSEIVMEHLLEGAEQPTIVVMTCAGESLGGGDATHRLIVTAVEA